VVEEHIRINTFMQIKWIVYRTSNILNGKFYIGVNKVRENDLLNESYLGSGPAIIAAVKKYGRENFKKEIIQIFDDAESAYAFEEKIVDASDRLSYNMKGGGLGGRGLKMSDKQKKQVSLHHKGKTNSPEQRKKISKSLKKFYFNNPEKAAEIGRTISQKYRENPDMGKRMKETMVELYRDNDELRARIGASVSEAANWSERPEYLEKMSIARKNSKRYRCSKCDSKKNFDGGNFSKHCKLMHSLSIDEIALLKCSCNLAPSNVSI
jgi:hypothetical protein